MTKTLNVMQIFVHLNLKLLDFLSDIVLIICVD